MYRFYFLILATNELFRKGYNSGQNSQKSSLYIQITRQLLFILMLKRHFAITAHSPRSNDP